MSPRPVARRGHGSEACSAVRHGYFPHRLPARGIGVIVVDERGYGDRSGRERQLSTCGPATRPPR